MMKIPLNQPYYGKEELEAATERIKSTWVTGGGPKGEEFEAELAKYLKAKHALFVNSGTAALHLSTMALDLKNKKVRSATTVYTFTSTALVLLEEGSKPHFIDIKENDCNIDPNKIKPGFFNVIIPIDFGGMPCDMKKIKEIADKNNCYIIQDAAQSIGALYNGKQMGHYADISCFSFHSAKNLVCGEGGAVVTNNDYIAKKIAIMREKGTDKQRIWSSKHSKKYFKFIDRGLSYVQSDILAAIALAQLKKLDKMNAMRTKHAEYLNKNLKEIPGIKLPEPDKNTVPNWCMYYFLAQNIDPIINELNKRGIQAKDYYTPLHLNPYYKKLYNYKKGDFPVAEKIGRSLIRLPMYPSLTKEQLDYIIENVHDAMRKQEH